MKKILLCVLIPMFSVMLFGCASKSYDVSVTIPAQSKDQFIYSDEEISPLGNTITLSCGEGLGDTEVILKTIDVKEENAYEPTYLTPGMSVKMNAEKDAWFKIGVNIQNPTDEAIQVYVHVSNVAI